MCQCINFIDSTCQTNPCLNGGICSLNQTSVAGAAVTITKCTCPLGFYGDICQYKNFCNPNSCQHNGQCTLIGTTSYSCDCNSSYTGRDCEKGKRQY